MALVGVRRAYFYAPAQRREFVELPLEDYQAGDEHMCRLLQYSLYGTRDAAQNWEEELASTLGDGERSVVEFLIKMTSRKYEIKKQVIGDDADLEKSGRILNGVVSASQSRRIRDTSGRY